jgi:putative phosphoesterase
LRLAVVADTHSQPHPGLDASLRALEPNAILHAGDIGDLVVLDRLATVAPVQVVRGNIDVHARDLPDVLTVDIVSPNALVLRLFLIHIGVNGPKIRADVARRARAKRASLVVCGHSHVPFIGKDRDLFVFNPGSAGPRRFDLPIVFGVIDIAPSGIRLRHVDCATGETWTPPGRPRAQ